MEAKKWIERHTDVQGTTLHTWVEINGKRKIVQTTILDYTQDMQGLVRNNTREAEHHAFYEALDFETAMSFFPRILRADKLEGFEPTFDLRKRAGQIEQRWVSTSGAVEWRRIPDEDEIEAI